jgi:hypothetical protein
LKIIFPMLPLLSFHITFQYILLHVPKISPSIFHSKQPKHTSQKKEEENKNKNKTKKVRKDTKTLF